MSNSKTIKTCPICKKEFAVYKSVEKRYTTCGDPDCKFKYRTGRPKKGHVIIKCKICGKEFKSFKSRIQSRKVCHNPDCLAKIRSINIAGEKCHWWEGGKSFEPYCPKFNEDLRRRVRAFFGYICLGCGKHQNDLNEKLSVHHVYHQKDACCDDKAIPLFAPLCRSCHVKTNNHKEHWMDILVNKILLDYEGKCYFTKEEWISVK
jgi:hypothetical protein